MAKKYRVLILAEMANPEWASVPLEGWSLSNALRDVADVHIVTQIRNSAAFLRAGLIEGKDFTAIDSEPLAAPAHKVASFLRGGSGKGWTTIMAVQSLTYPYFERLVWKRFGDAIRRGDFDIVHRITPLTPTAPSPIARKCARSGTVFLLGPLNGGLPWPAAFSAERHKEKEWLSYVRSFYKLLPGHRSTLTFSKVIIAGSRSTEAEIPPSFREKVIYMPENGVDPARFNSVSVPSKGMPMKMCFVGRLVPYKGADMAIDAALMLLRTGRAHLDIVGDGPMMQELVAKVRSEKIEEAVTFHGWVDHQMVQGITSGCSVFLFPSVREFGGAVVLEAMALGLAPVVVDYGGPGELVANGRGLAVPIGSRESIVENVSAALEYFSANPEEVTRLGERARTWAMTNLTWPAKARNMLEIYDWALGKQTSRPLIY